MTVAARIVPLVLLSACADPPPEPEGAHYQYVVSALHIPMTNTEAREFGSDLNGDGAIDNQLGMIFSTLDAMGLGVDDTARESLLRGGLVMLADLQTPAFDQTEASGVRTYLGNTPPAPCIEPEDLATCGQHLLGTGEFTVQDASASDLAVAPIVDGRFSAYVGRLPVQLTIVDPDEPIEVVLQGARVRMSSISPQGANAAIGGGITRADIDGVVIPVTAAQVDRILMEDCTAGSMPTGCTCLQDSDGRLFRDLFDTDPRDCHISVEELRQNSLVNSLFSPDVEIDGEEMLSFGVAAELASAAFGTP